MSLILSRTQSLRPSASSFDVQVAFENCIHGTFSNLAFVRIDHV
jgi:hypothetical protein